MKHASVILWVILLLYLVAPSSPSSSTAIMYDKPHRKSEHKIWLFEKIKRDREEKFDRVQELVKRDKLLEELDQIIEVFTEEDEVPQNGGIDPVTGLPLPEREEE